jgi:hypothetical protein
VTARGEAELNKRITATLSFDHLVRPEKNRLWNRQADLFCRLKIDHQLELGWLFDWDVDDFSAAEEFDDLLVESRMGAVAWGLWPTLRFPPPAHQP